MRSTAPLFAASALTMPRAIIGGLVRAEESPASVVARLDAAFAAFRDKHEARYTEIEAHLDAQAVANATRGLGGVSAGLPSDPDYTRTFASYFRQGIEADALRNANATGERQQIQAAMSVGSNSDGGYIAPTEWDRQIRQAQVIVSPMRQIAQVQQTSVGAFSTVWNNNQWGSGWVGEVAPRPATSTPSLSTLTFAAGEIYASPTITQRLLDDALVNVDSWLSDQVSVEFSRQEGIAFTAGDGVNKPRGLLTYVTGGASDGVHPGGNLTVVASGDAATIKADGLIAFMYGLPAPYRQNAVWTMSSVTAAAVMTLKDGMGRYLWADGLIAGQPATLLGKRVVIDETMPAPTAGNTPIAFGDFRAGYLINDRLGVRVLRDPYTVKGFVQFYTTKRIGAGLLDPNAIRLLKIAAN